MFYINFRLYRQNLQYQSIENKVQMRKRYGWWLCSFLDTIAEFDLFFDSSRRSLPVFRLTTGLFFILHFILLFAFPALPYFVSLFGWRRRPCVLLHDRNCG